MQDLDPASLLFMPPNAALVLDSSLFESVGRGVCENAFTIEEQKIASATSTIGQSSSAKSTCPLPERVENIASAIQGQKDSSSSCSTTAANHDESTNSESRSKWIGLAQGWDTVCSEELDQRVLQIDRENILHVFHNSGSTTLTPVSDRSVSDDGNNSATDAEVALTMAPVHGIGLYDPWRKHTVFGSLSHPSGSLYAEDDEATDEKARRWTSGDSVDLKFELPPLTKRPRDIVDECILGEGSLEDISSVKRGRVKETSRRLSNARKPSDERDKDSQVKVDTWRAAGMPAWTDTATEKPPLKRPLRMSMLSWETCDKNGPVPQPTVPIISPYVTEAGSVAFEGIYKRLVDYSFKFKPKPILVSHEDLVKCAFLLLGGTESSIFRFNATCKKFELTSEDVRIEGCSAESVSGLLQDLLTTGTHMRRLILMTSSCTLPKEGMGLIQIAFGQSLLSYLMFLQGSVLALQESAEHRIKHIIELCHRTHDMGLMMSRLAYICGCHVSLDSQDIGAAIESFPLPPGPDLLSKLYNEILQQPTTDSLWLALLMALLDHASKPYRDMLGRWIGLSPRGTVPERISEKTLPGSSQGTVKANKTREGFSVFGSHLQQTLQDLDPFDEFFVASRHHWSWEGHGNICLLDPLDYETEFQMSSSVKPATFIDDDLANILLEAGKELQILKEYDPRHPLLTEDHDADAGISIEWIYRQQDVIELWKKCTMSAKRTMDALAARLESKGRIHRSGDHHVLRSQDINVNAIDSIWGQNSFSGETMDLDPFKDPFGSHNNDASGYVGLTAQEPQSVLNPTLAGFFSLSTTGPQSSELKLACPELMEVFLGESTTTGIRLLDIQPPLSVMTAHSIRYSIEHRASMIRTSVLSLYFHDLNLMDHLEAMGKLMLMQDAMFLSRLSEALFEEGTGLLTKACAMEASSSWPPMHGELEMALRAVLLDSFQESMSSEPEKESQGQVDGTNIKDHPLQEVGIDWMDLDHSIRSIPTRDMEESRMYLPTKRTLKFKSQSLSVQELEDMFAFAVKSYDEQTTKNCRDANALEALDFLYLDYKAPRPLQLLIFTPEAMEKYTRLFTFQLQLARVDAVMKQVYAQLRMRQKMLERFRNDATENKKESEGGRISNKETREVDDDDDTSYWSLQMTEMGILHRYRFEAQQIFKGLQAYVSEDGIGTSWYVFMQRLLAFQKRVEARILNRHNGSDSGVQGISPPAEWHRGPQDADMNQGKAYTDLKSNDNGDSASDDEEDEDTENDLAEDASLSSLVSLQEYHEHILDQMLLQTLLKRKQAPILKLVRGILNCMLKLGQYVKGLGSNEETHADADTDGQGGGGRMSRLAHRLNKLQAMQEKFRSLCRMLVKVLRVLDERGIGVEGKHPMASSGAETNRSDGRETDHAFQSVGGFLPQLLLRLDMSGFNQQE
ncbi:hypothetical protein BGZ94_008424 [Podila epigama]|nr:hypothetical protein BGZ94_008424 [Podila epigama]